ncbi:YihY/virulence factor BrkB family protein [Mycolicibacterium aurum]|uniref:YihY/virulence factor BrkB family protein n=1 Tax=Mycolicibacterium aurum TaxID=1791 RepID=UPI00278BC918|nr:YihY/virulence factor BrkB family protein [Mycolicibacterium aurum]
MGRPRATPDSPAQRREASGSEPVEDESFDEPVNPPEPDDSRKPDSPTDLTRPSIFYVLRRTASEFSRDQCTDLAAALTYYAVLSLFPALVVVMSLLGVLGQGPRTADAILQIIDDVSPGAAVEVLRQPIEQLVTAPSAGFALVTGILGALWSASGFVGAFGRAMNRVYEVDEGRPGWKLRLQQLLLTLVGLVVAAAVALILAVSGPVAEAVGGYLGVGATGLAVWNVARWPVLVVLVALGVAMLYYIGPNVKQPKFRWISVGAGLAIVVWICASLLFGLYVSNFGSYNKTFGALAGVIVFLLWLWITNLALLFGAEIDAELERGRQLQAGIEAEDDLQLPLRDTSAIDKSRDKERKGVLRGRALRRSRGRQA